MPKLSSVLLIDDDSTTNFLSELLLRTMKVAEHLLVAENGQEALRALAHACADPIAPSCPQLILLDMNMPVMNGLAFLEAYSQLPPTHQRATIIMLTTSLHERDLAPIGQFPIAGFLDKPLTREKVLAVLEEHFSA